MYRYLAHSYLYSYTSLRSGGDHPVCVQPMDVNVHGLSLYCLPIFTSCSVVGTYACNLRDQS